MRTLDIKYRGGSMRIYVDEFFPASKPRIRKLLQVVQMDYTDRVPELLQLLNECVEDVRKAIGEGNIKAPRLSKKVVEAERSVQVAQSELNAARSRKLGREIQKKYSDKLKAAREARKDAAAEYRACVKDLERVRRKGIGLIQNIEYIEEETSRDE